MNGTDMLKQEAEFHYRYIRKQVERLEEMKREGRRYIDMPIDEVIKMFMEAHALHMHLDRVQQYVGNIGMYAVNQTFVPVSEMSGAIAPGTDILAQVEARQQAYSDAISRGDVKEMERLAPRGKTYGEVVKPHSPEEEKRLIDAANKARGVL